MQQIRHPQGLQIRRAHLHVPDEVPGPEGLHHAPQAGVPPHPLLPRLVRPLPIRAEHVQRGRGHERRVDEGCGVQVPLQLGAGREVGVGGGQQVGGDEGREEGVEGGEEEVAEEDFVDVEGESVQVEEVGYGLDGIAEGGRNRDGVEHRACGGVERQMLKRRYSMGRRGKMQLFRRRKWACGGRVLEHWVREVDNRDPESSEYVEVRTKNLANGRQASSPVGKAAGE